MLKRAGCEPNVVEGRFIVHARHQQRSRSVIVEPDTDAHLLLVVICAGPAK